MSSRKNSFSIYILLVACMSLIIISLFYFVRYINGIVIATILYILFFYFILVLRGVDIVSNLVYLIPGLGTLYTVTYPYFKYNLDLLPTSFREITNSDVLNGTFFSAVLVIMYTVFTAFPKETHARGGEQDNYRIEYYRTITMESTSIAIDILFIVFYIIMLGLYNSMGGFNAVFSGTITRRVLSDTYNSTASIYGYVKYMYVAYTIFAVYSLLNRQNRNINKVLNYVRIILVTSFWAFDIALGNRRCIIYILLSLIFYFVNKKRNRESRLLFMLLTLIVIVGLMYVGVARNVGNSDIEIRIRDAFGEFIYPMVTLYYYIGTEVKFLYGKSFFYTLTALIPRAVWSDKPYSLALLFKNDYGTEMGYGYTPFTEMYKNFGMWGCVIGALALFYIFNSLTKNKEKYPLLYLATYIQIINFFRGEFASSVTEVFIIWATFRVLYLLNKRKVRTI